MKKIAALLLLVIVLSASVMAGESQKNRTFGVFENRLMWGLSLEVTGFVETPAEPLLRVGTDLLVPITKRLSVGGFAGACYMDWDAGVSASWRFLDESRAVVGFGFSETYYTSIVRLAYKTTGPWYFSGWFSPVFVSGEFCFSVGVGYSFLGGRRR